MWWAAWKLVSNDAKRTVPPPNAKHSTLLQGCFLCFCFSPLHFSTEPIYLRHDDRHKAKRQRGEAVGWQAPPHCG